MDGEQLERVLKNWLKEREGIDGYDFDGIYTDFIYDGAYGLKPETEMKANVVKVTVVDSNAHEEGQYHTDLYVVLRVSGPDGIQYFKKSGYYQSYDGEYWDGPLTEVYPEEKVVTEWVNNGAIGSYESIYSF